jgi:AcrR family transcriptional regulator
MRTTRIRLSPEARREQLLDLGVQMLATRSVEELSIDLLAEEAGISRGLLYHYFANKHEFHHAVVRRAADDVIRVTAPPAEGEPLERLAASLEAYVDYVVANFEGYSSLVRGAASGNPGLREIYEEARAALTDRIFATAGPEGLAAFGIADTPATRLMVRGWSAMTEEVVLSWVRADTGVSKQELLELLAAALPAVLPSAASPARPGSRPGS